jgi:hypothetical protein
MLDLVQRKRDELDQLTIAVASGYAMTMDSKFASKWAAEHSNAPDHSQAAIQRQSGSIGRLAAMFPGSVKTKTN